MKKKIIALILCICLISCTCIQPAYAMGAEGIIVGGGAAAAGVTLTMPQVALLVAAGFGLVYATQHAEEIYNGLDTALTNAANNIEGGIEQLSTWTEKAMVGQVAIASAPSWIYEEIKAWISGLYQSADYVDIACVEHEAGALVPSSRFWDGSYIGKTVPTVALRTATVEIIPAGTHYSLISRLAIVSTQSHTGYDYVYSYQGTTYYIDYETWATNPKVGEMSEYNQMAYDSLLLLPQHALIMEKYEGENAAIAMLKAWVDGLFPSGSGSVCPDEKVGGIDDALGQHAIDNINVPDLDIGGSGLLAPDNVGTGSIDDVLNDILTRLKQQELSWSDYMSDVAVGTPSITIEGKDYAIDDTGVTDIPVEDVVPDNPPADGVVVPEGLEPFTMSLTDFFPFCIPFDIVDFVNVLCAEPEAPRFEWEFQWYGGQTDTLTIDLSPFDQVAQLLRNMELLLFCIGLALITREQIRG